MNVQVGVEVANPGQRSTNQVQALIFSARNRLFSRLINDVICGSTGRVNEREKGLLGEQTGRWR